MASTDQLADVIPIETARRNDEHASGFTVVDKRGKNLARGVGKRAMATATALNKEQLTANVKNLAGALWWNMQGAAQRGDHVALSRHSIARSRVIAEAKRQDIHVGV